MSNQWVESLVLGKDDANGVSGGFKHLPEFAGNEEIQCIWTTGIDRLPVDAVTPRLCGCHQIKRDGFL